jgi:hypothetical protein
MNYTPRSEKELAEASLLPKGEYPIEFVNAEEAKSKKSNNDMLVIDVDILTESGGRRRVRDYIVPGTIWADKKLADLMNAVGLPYHAGALSVDGLLSKSCYAAVGIDEGKPWTGSDGVKRAGLPKNKIAYYMKQLGAKPKSSGPSAPKPRPTSEEMQAFPPNKGGTATKDLDEDVPF